jgi:hypothetical protein
MSDRTPFPPLAPIAGRRDRDRIILRKMIAHRLLLKQILQNTHKPYPRPPAHMHPLDRDNEQSHLHSEEIEVDIAMDTMIEGLVLEDQE